MHRDKRITRRAVLKTLAMSVPIVGLGTRALAAAQGHASRQVLRKNVVLFITDQERAIQHFPVNWERDNLPGLSRLKRNGLTFERAFTDACMCSPACSTWVTGYFPVQHGVKYTLEENMPGSTKSSGRTSPRLAEHCQRHVRRRLQRGVQGQVTLQ